MPYQYNPTQPFGMTQASGLATNLMGNYQTGRDNFGQNIFGRLGQATSNLANYTPEKVNVPRLEQVPAEYYQRQIEQLSQPLKEQYQEARAMTRGDQAARGNIYDYEGQKGIFDLDKRYLQELGRVTSDVAQQQMAQRNANEQFNIQNILAEDQARRNLGFENVGRTGQMFTQAALQQQDIDTDALNQLLNYGFNIYGKDVERDIDRRKNILELLNLQGYQGVPQEQLWSALSGELGYPVKILG